MARTTHYFTIKEATATFPFLSSVISEAQKAGLVLRQVGVTYNNGDIEKHTILVGEIAPQEWSIKELEEWLVKYGDKIKSSVPKPYLIPVTRIGYAYRNIEVEATSQEEAEDKALEIAGNFEFSERESEYKVVY